MTKMSSLNLALTVLVLMGLFICSTAIFNCQSLNTTDSSKCAVCSPGFQRTTSMQYCLK